MNPAQTGKIGKSDDPREFMVYINSAIDRQVNESTTRWTTTIGKADQLTTSGKISMKLDQIELPNLLPTFPEHSSILFYEYDTDGVNTVHSCDLRASGSVVYDNPAEIANFVTSEFTANGHNSLTLTYNSSVNKFSFNNTSLVKVRLIGSYRFSDRFDVTYNNAADRLGLIQDTTGQPTNSGDTLQFRGIPRLLPTQCYYLICKQLSSKKQILMPQDSSGNPRYIKPLARITAGSYGTLSQLQFASDNELELARGPFSVLEFTLFDDEYYEVDLGGQAITMSLKVIVV